MSVVMSVMTMLSAGSGLFSRDAMVVVMMIITRCGFQIGTAVRRATMMTMMVMMVVMSRAV